jgi:hypothetical protein
VVRFGQSSTVRQAERRRAHQGSMQARAQSSGGTVTRVHVHWHKKGPLTPCAVCTPNQKAGDPIFSFGAGGTTMEALNLVMTSVCLGALYTAYDSLRIQTER